MKKKLFCAWLILVCAAGAVLGVLVMAIRENPREVFVVLGTCVWLLAVGWAAMTVVLSKTETRREFDLGEETKKLKSVDSILEEEGVSQESDRKLESDGMSRCPTPGCHPGHRCQMCS